MEGGISIKSTIKRIIVAALAFILMSIGGVFGTVFMLESEAPVLERGIREKRIKSNDLDGKKNRFEQIQNEAELKQQIGMLREEVRSLSNQLNAEKKTPID